MIPFLSLKDVTAAHGEEIQAAVKRVVDSGWYLQGEENARFGKNPPSFQPGASNSFRFVSLLHTILSKS